MIRYLANSEADLQGMLETIGVGSAEELFAPIPPRLRLQETLDLPPARSEVEIMAEFTARARRNRIPPDIHAFLGAGCYHHFIPAVVRDVLGKPEFATPYTPYQAELSQGTLQSIFEFQTYVCQLTALEVANASLYDGATALAEAVLMAHRIHRGRRNHLLVARALHPEYRQVLATYTHHLGIRLEEIPFEAASGRTDLDVLTARLQDDTFAVALQSPNFFGIIEDWGAVSAALGDHPAIKIACFTEALSLGLLQPPGEAGFDIAVGEGQSLGLPMGFGGPHVGLFATRQRYLHRMPGRLVGETRDPDGRRGFVMTLMAREQHIRREKATSNICTNQALCALAATVYLALMGPRGLRQLAELNTRRAHAVAEGLEEAGTRLSFSGAFFNEFVLCGRDLVEKRHRLLDQDIVLGLPLGRWYPELGQHLLVAVTEMNEPTAIDDLMRAWRTLSREETP